MLNTATAAACAMIRSSSLLRCLLALAAGGALLAACQTTAGGDTSGAADVPLPLPSGILSRALYLAQREANEAEDREHSTTTGKKDAAGDEDWECDAPREFIPTHEWQEVSGPARRHAS